LQSPSQMRAVIAFSITDEGSHCNLHHRWGQSLQSPS